MILLLFVIGDDYVYEMNETELLKAFRESRSEAAFVQLLNQYAGLVYSVARRRLANASLAEDITQLVFIRLAKTPPAVDTPAELAAWLHRTTVNVAIDTWRSETRRQNREQQAIAMEPATRDNADWEDIAPKLDEALNQLNDDDRQALLLRYFAQKAMREVGAALGVSENAAKMRVNRALDRLRTQLGGGGVACTAAVLGTLLLDRSVEAVPVHLFSRLRSIKVPAAAGAAGVFSSLLQISRFNLAAGAAVLLLVGVGAVHLLYPSRAPAPARAATIARTDPGAPATQDRSASRDRFDPRGWNTPLAQPMSNAPAAKPTMISFQVLDAETGGPVADANIHIACFGPGGAGESHEMVTDNSGDAAIPEPVDPTKSQGVNVFVSATGYVPKVVGFQAGKIPAEYTMKLDTAMAVGGWVVDEQGQPVAGVRIFVQGPGNVPGQAENVDFQTCPVTSRDDGSWTCSYIPKDWTNEIRLVLRKEGYATTFPTVPVAKVDLNSLVLVLNRGFTVTGRVVDTRDQAVADAHIKILTSETGKRQSVDTDENGIFTLTGVAGDSAFSREPRLETNDSGTVFIRGLIGEGSLHVNLAVQADGFAPRTDTVELSKATNAAEFVLSPGHVFRGRVVDESGKPISNAVVQTDWDNQGLRAFDWKTRTDAAGRFEWDSAPGGPTLFWFEAAGYRWNRGVSLSADGSDHRVVLNRPTTP